MEREPVSIKHRLLELLPLFLVNALIVGVAYGLYLDNYIFSVDSYALMYPSVPTYRIDLTTGRAFTSLLVFLLDLVGLWHWENQWVNALFLIVSAALSATLLTRRASGLLQPVGAKHGRTKLLLLDLVFLTAFVNVFFTSWFAFSNLSLNFGVGCLMACGAVLTVTKQRSVPRILAALLLLTLSVSVYEAFLGFYIILSCALLAAKHKLSFTRECLRDFLVMLGVGIVSALLYFLSIWAMCAIMNVPYRNSRIDGLTLEILFRNISLITRGQPDIWLKSAYGLMPRFAMFSYAVLLIGLFFAARCTDKQRKPFRAGNAILWTLVFLGCCISVYLPHSIAVAFWPAERTVFTIFSLFSVLGAYLAAVCSRESLIKIAAAVSALFLAISCVCIQDIAKDQIFTNRLDKAYVLQIDSAIKEHEAESGEQITSLAFCQDMTPTCGYFTCVEHILYDSNVSSRVVSWSSGPMFRFYTSDRYTIVSTPQDIYDTYFAGKDWTQLDVDEQIVFLDGTAYVCGY